MTSLPPTAPETPKANPRDYALGSALAFAGGALTLALAAHFDSYGWAFVLGIPLCMGFVLGYATDAPRATHVLAVVLLVAGLIGGAIAGGLAGGVCGGVAATILILPTFVGAQLGALVRLLRGGDSGRPVTTAIVLFFTCSALLVAESHFAPRHPEESITTRRTLPLSVDEAWRALLFYEEVTHSPPLFARIGLPRPLRTEGEIRRVGDVKRCIYSTGHLRKRITAYQPGRRLAFEVIEQRGIEDRSVDLTGGSIELEPLPDGTTRMTLVTTYRPLLGAREVWRPFERSLARMVHQHVLEGMERQPGGALQLAHSGRPAPR